MSEIAWDEVEPYITVYATQDGYFTTAKEAEENRLPGSLILVLTKTHAGIVMLDYDELKSGEGGLPKTIPVKPRSMKEWFDTAVNSRSQDDE